MAINRRSPLVSRARELAALQQLMSITAGGQGALALLSGEPGIGKTRLLSELGATARVQGWTVLCGRASADGLAPYLAFREALRDALQKFPADTGATAHRAIASDLDRLRPELAAGRAVSGADVPADRYQLCEAVCGLLLAIATNAAPGAVLLLDDLQWADTPSLELLKQLARRVGEAPLLVLGAYRTTDLPPTHPLAELLAELRRERLDTRLPLLPLDAAGTGALLTGLTGRPPAPAVAAAVYAQTQGNPFFIEEVVHHLQEQMVDLADDQTRVTGWGIPSGVREVIGRRLARLGAETVRMLGAGAVLGETFPIAVLAAMVDLGWDALAAAIEEAEAAGLLQETDEGYRFAHALVRQTVLEQLSLPRRQRLHLAAAQAIENVFRHNVAQHAAEVAGHYRRAGATADPNTVLHYTSQAAGQAEAVFAWEEAATHWQTALAALDAGAAGGPGLRAERLLALGAAQYAASEFSDWRATFQQAAAAARAAGDARLLARAALGHADLSTFARLDDAALALLEEALGALGDGDGILRARLLAISVEVLVFGGGDHARVMHQSSEAVVLAQRLGDPATLAHALNERLWALHDSEYVAEMRTHTASLLALARDLGDPDLLLRGRRWQLYGLLAEGDIATLTAELDRYSTEIQSARRPLYQGVADSMRLPLRVRMGQFRELERQWQTPGLPHAWGWGRLGRPLNALIQAREAGAAVDPVPLLRAARDAYPNFWLIKAALAVLSAEAGRDAAARTALATAADVCLSTRSHQVYARTTLCLLAEAAVLLGDRERAAALYARLLPHAGLAMGALCVAYDGVVDRYLGRLATALGDQGAAATHFEQALAVCARMCGPRGGGHVRREYAELLLMDAAHQDVPRARRLLGEARAVYREAGMEMWAERTQDLLRRVSAPAPPRPHRPDRLSPRQLEVLRLLAAGKTNAEVAMALTLSVHTVERHVANLYGKLGVHGRAEAAAYAVRRGLV